MGLDVNDDVDEVAKDFEGADGTSYLEGDSDVEECVVERNSRKEQKKITQEAVVLKE